MSFDISRNKKTAQSFNVCIFPLQIFDKMIKFAGFSTALGFRAACLADWWIPNGLKTRVGGGEATKREAERRLTCSRLSKLLQPNFAIQTRRAVMRGHLGQARTL